MKTYQLNLSDGAVTSIAIDESVSDIETEIAKLGGVIKKNAIEGDPKSQSVTVSISSYQFLFNS